MSQFPTRAEIVSARSVLAPVLDPTPLQRSRSLEEASGTRRVFLKPENLQRTGSFKFRGAYHKLSTLSEAERQKGVITYSSGNHGQAVALSAKLFGTRATVVVPEDTNPYKIAAAEAYGATIVKHGFTSNERRAEAYALAKAHGHSMISPFDDPKIIVGQATICLEMLDEQPDLDVILVPVGGGGLLAGIALAASEQRPSLKVIGVEPADASDARSSLKEGRLVTIGRTHTIADGLRTSSLGELNYAIIRQHVHDIVTVTDEEIKSAMSWLLMRAKLVVEPSGAVSVAGLLSGSFAGKNVGAVLSGGNATPDLLAEIAARAH